MKRSTGSLLFLLAGAALGVAATALFAMNPFGWAWYPGVIRQEPDSYPNGSMAHARGEASGERRVLYWRAPMDPNYRSDRPGKSPMGMDLVPVYDDAGADDGTVRVSPRFLQNFAVRTAEVERGAVPLSIRTVGVLAHNDEKVVSVNTKFEGWIERARVNNVGESVERGDVLFDIYSPELVTTQQEYIATIDYVERLRQAGAYPDAVERARSLLEAARARLRHWDVTETQIAGLEAAGRASRTVQVLAPASGFIVEKMGDSLEGMKLTPGMTVLKIADHSTLWAKAEFYAEDLRHVHEGSLRVHRGGRVSRAPLDRHDPVLPLRRESRDAGTDGVRRDRQSGPRPASHDVRQRIHTGGGCSRRRRGTGGVGAAYRRPRSRDRGSRRGRIRAARSGTGPRCRRHAGGHGRPRAR